jgi:hypothetical protein
MTVHINDFVVVTATTMTVMAIKHLLASFRD